MFAVLGDASPAAVKDPPSRVLVQAVEEINQTGAELVLFTGDLVCGRTLRRDDTRRQFDEAKSALDRLRAKLLIVPGNHDVDGAGGREEFERHFGAAPWSFTHRGWTFLGLSTEEPGTRGLIAGEQRQWLERQLADAQSKLIVVMHRPVWPTLLPEHRYHSLPQPELHELLARHSAAAVFCGHEHHYQQQSKDGVQYLITGGAGASLLPDGYHHFLLATVKGGRLSVEVRPLN